MLEKAKLKCKTAGISAETRSVVGYPSEVITKQAEEDNVDIVFMGMVGLRGISRIEPLEVLLDASPKRQNVLSFLFINSILCKYLVVSYFIVN